MNPKILIVIGNSCAGKSTFVRYYNNYFDHIYNEIDDYSPLREVFNIDDILWRGELQEFISYRNRMKFSLEIWEAYNKILKEGKDVKKYLYTKSAMNGGHDIIRPLLWDKILKFSLQNIENDKLYIIQFSRGRDSKYEKELSFNDIYDRSLRIIIDGINPELIQDMLIVNLSASLEVRKRRNTNRYLDGGHYVSDETMINVYNKDIFTYNKLSFLKCCLRILSNSSTFLPCPTYPLNRV